MLNFSPREYSIRELYDSYKRGETLLSPKFQRRPVWELKAKSYLIDSIIKGFPIPRIFIRESTNYDLSAKREIVDGQQRLQAIFDYLNDGFKMSKIHNKEYGELFYSELPDDVKKTFLQYTVSAIVLVEMSDNMVFDIFARLNTYSVKLNTQELLNSQFFGVYKQLIYKLAQEYRTFWIDSKILSERNISRMEDAKLVSEIISVIVENKITSYGLDQAKKLYARFDDEFNIADKIETNFKKTLDLFSKVYADSFSSTTFTKIPLFYSTFLALYGLNYPLAIFNNETYIFDESVLSKVRIALDEINQIAVTSINDLNNTELQFVNTLKKNTTTPDVRLKRCVFIFNKLKTTLLNL